MEHFSFASISQAFLIRTRFRYSDGVILVASIKILRMCVSLRPHALARSLAMNPDVMLFDEPTIRIVQVRHVGADASGEHAGSYTDDRVKFHG